MSLKVENPLYDTLHSMLREEPPEFVKGHFHTITLDDEEYNALQEWCVSNALPEWSTGIGIIEAACEIIHEAIGNGNIQGASG